MKLCFLYHPVNNLKESLTFYRDVLGFEEAWREGNHTIALSIPNTEQRIMIEEDEHDLGAGGIFLVDSVEEYYNEHQSKVNFVKMPSDIPPGKYAIYLDDSGNPIRIIDFSNEK